MLRKIVSDLSSTCLLAAMASIALSAPSGLDSRTAHSSFPPALIAAWYWPFSSSEGHKQLQAANERINDLTKLKGDLEAKAKELQAELASAKAEAAAALQQTSEK